MNNQKRRLFQPFTSQVIVKFMFSLVGFDPPRKAMDLACGGGAFLKQALRHGTVTVASIDVDPETIEPVRENLREFKGRFRLFSPDGLAEIECKSGFQKEDHDLVIGNPSFASSKWGVRDKEVLCYFALANIENKRNSLHLQLSRPDESVRPVKPWASQVIEVFFLN